MAKRKRESVTFTDWLARMYPEIASKSIQFDDPDKYLSAKTFTFQVTDACNLACTYCYQINKGVRKMPFEIAKLAVDKLLGIEPGFESYMGVDNSFGIILDFIGGEPFLEIELIDKIVDYFRMRAIEINHPWAEKYAISICSNGVLYTDPKVQAFLQKNIEHLSFNVTVDGTKELHDACRVFPDGSPSYDLAHSAAMDWVAKGYEMGSKITIAPSNIDYLADSLKAMVNDGYTEINANCVFEKGWKTEHAAKMYWQCKEFADWFAKEHDLNDYFISLLDERNGRPMPEKDDRNWCGGTGLMLSVDPEGRLYPCIRYMESSLGRDQKPLVIGDVWHGIGKEKCENDCLNCMNGITRKSQSTDECFYCPIARGCAWCSAHNYQDSGSINHRATYICEMHKARMLAVCYYWNSYHKKVNDGKVFDLWVPRKWAENIIGSEEYDYLAELTRSLGGYVNEDATMVKLLGVANEKDTTALTEVGDKSKYYKVLKAE